MTHPHPTTPTDHRTDPFRHGRGENARVRSDFSDPNHPPSSQRAYARESDISRSTLGDLLRDPGPADLPPHLVAFLRSPDGETFLHRLVHAAFIAFRHRGPCGIRSVSLFLQLAQIDRFVGSSYGALHTLDDNLQTNLIAFRDQEQPRLVEQMPDKAITVVPDENFHGRRTCLVAIEPVSNFILVEQYAARRDGDTWTDAIGQATKDWPVEIVQLTSDQSSALVRCAEEGLQANYSPDLLHLQRDLFKPLLLPLQRPITKAQNDLEKATEKVDKLEKVHRAYQVGDPQVQPIDYFTPMIEEVGKQIHAEQQIKQGQERVEKVVEAVRGIGDDYRPFDYQTGRPVTAEQVASRLGERLVKIDEVAAEAGLGARAVQGVDKARGWVGMLVACVAWFWGVANKRVEELDLSEQAERQVRECLIAGYYWEAAARKGRDAEERERLKGLGERLLEEAWTEGGALAALGQEQKKEVQRVARECAELFQRSSSCVEGRNGRLSLFHHGQGKLSDKRLQSLTVVHNYLVKRADGTTAAQRLFGTKPPDLFDWLLKSMPDLPRPAAKRDKQPSKIASNAA
jgi:Family of unknown function (DUF6399)